MLWQPTRGILQPGQHWRRSQGAAAAPFAIDGTPTFNNAGGSSLGVFVPATTYAGDWIFVAAVSNSGPSSISDNGGGALSSWTKYSGGSSGQPMDLWRAYAASTVSASTITVTVNQSGGGYHVVDCWAVSGADAASPVDGSPTIGAGGDVGSATRTISTSNADDMIIGVHRLSSDATGSVGGGWTAIANSDFRTYGYQIFTSTQSSLPFDISRIVNGTVLIAIKKA